jgi:hypothetical protein
MSTLTRESTETTPYYDGYHVEQGLCQKSAKIEAIFFILLYQLVIDVKKGVHKKI